MGKKETCNHENRIFSFALGWYCLDCKKSMSEIYPYEYIREGDNV